MTMFESLIFSIFLQEEGDIMQIRLTRIVTKISLSHLEPV